MALTYILTVASGAPTSGADSTNAVAAIVASVPGATEALLFTPATTHDPFLDDGPAPPLAVQLAFPDIATLEAALVVGSRLAALRDLWPDAEIAEQAMLVRRFPVPNPASTSPQPCTYMVAYNGTAANENAWLSHYIAHHPRLMARLPGIRQLEVYTRLDWCSAMPWQRAFALQRNKVVFDSPTALTAALSSPERQAMRADFHALPAFHGQVTHFAMHTQRLISA